jgi:phenylacetate-CoA ligase
MTIKDSVFQRAEAWSSLLSHLPATVRVGHGYLGVTRRIRAAERMNSSATESWLLSSLQRLLIHANTHVDFYRDFYREKGYSPRDFQTLADWEHVPVVTKQDLHSRPLSERCAQGRNGVPVNTGGTSGTPLAFLLERNASPFEWAHMHHIWCARGYRVSQLKLRIGGTYFTNGVPVVYHPRHNEYIVNANCSAQQVVDAVLALSEKHSFGWVHGYPSLVAEFAQVLGAQSSPSARSFVAKLKGVLLGSEFPAPMYRQPIAELLSSNIVSWYGQSEMTVLARETAKGVYQSLATYGYTEAVPLVGGDQSRLVSTSLCNFVHPFIRYDTGDLISPIASYDGSLAFRISEGRIGDFILDRNGRKLSLTSIIFGRHHACFNDILHLQVRQTQPGHITLLVVPRDAGHDLSALTSGFDFTGLAFDFDVAIVDRPYRTTSGKLKLLLDA